MSRHPEPESPGHLSARYGVMSVLPMLIVGWCSLVLADQTGLLLVASLLIVVILGRCCAVLPCWSRRGILASSCRCGAGNRRPEIPRPIWLWQSFPLSAYSPHAHFTTSTHACCRPRSRRALDRVFQWGFLDSKPPTQARQRLPKKRSARPQARQPRRKPPRRHRPQQARRWASLRPPPYSAEWPSRSPSAPTPAPPSPPWCRSAPTRKIYPPPRRR
jgi:hypothetical protein